MISGNKWRKLKLNLQQARFKGQQSLLTMGGAHSNHILATAEAARIFGFKSIGIIRGMAAKLENPTLSAAAKAGMRIEIVPKSDFDFYQTWEGKDALKASFGNCYFIPQGGANYYGVQGCQEIIGELPFMPDRIFLATATGTTLQGLTLAAKGETRLTAISVLKGEDLIRPKMEADFLSLLGDRETVEDLMSTVEILSDFHHGGYAKTSIELISFMQRFHNETGIKLDPVYTAKAAYAMFELAKKAVLSKSEKWVFMHTGGLQGIAAMEDQLGYEIYPDC